MNVVVHIGTEKTGTSSIQEFMNANRDVFPSIGFAYLKSPGMCNNRKFATWAMDLEQNDDHVYALNIVDPDKRKKWKKSFEKELKAELNNLPRKVKTVIVSSEHFHSRLMNEASVLRLKSLLSKFFSDIKIVVYLRRQDRVAVSFYSTRLLNGYAADSVFQNVKEVNHFYNYNNLLTLWASVFGKENIRPCVFERKKFKNGNLIDDFLDHAGVDVTSAEFVYPPQANESLNSSTLQVLKHLNRHFKSSKADFSSQYGLRPFFINNMRDEKNDIGHLPSRDSAVDFYNIFHKSNTELAAEWFDGNLFDDDFSMYPVDPQKSGNSHLLDIVFRVIESFLSRHVLIRKGNLYRRLKSHNNHAEIFRDLALLYEDSDISLAYFFMTKAKECRPNGPLIIKKWLELKVKLNDSESGDV